MFFLFIFVYNTILYISFFYHFKPKDMSKYNAAATKIQAHARGMFARNRTKKTLKNIPHVIEMNVDYATDLPNNKDWTSSKPDVYVLVNVFRKVGKLERCYSTSKTRVIPGNTNPVFEEDLRLAGVGQGTVVVNVMSQHSFGGDTLIGQVLIYYFI